MCAMDGVEQPSDFLPRKDDRQPFRALRPDRLERRHFDLEDMFVKEQHRTEILRLRTCRYMPIDGKVRQILLNFRRAHFAGMSLVMKQDESPHPMQIGLLRPQPVRQLSKQLPRFAGVFHCTLAGAS